MSDKEKDIATDFEEKLAEIASKKSRYRNRTKNNIYERFISRVHSDEDDEKDNSDTDNFFADAPFSTNNPEPFSNQDNEREGQFDATDTTTTTTDVTFDFSDESLEQDTFKSEPLIKKETQYTDNYLENSDLDDDLFNINFNDDINHTNQDTEPASPMCSDTDKTAHKLDSDTHLDTQDLSIQPPIKEVAPAHDNDKLASHKKSLIIGMVVGSLLIGIVVAILIFTGVLSPSAQSDALHAAETSTNNEVATDPVAVVSTAAPTTVDKPLLADTSPDSLPTVEPQHNSLTNDDPQGAVNNSTAATPAAIDNGLDNLDSLDQSETQPAITYEDFREESQTTLYRETND
jgi:hypothetical protein